MKIEFRKIAPEPKDFALELKNSDFDIKVNGTISRNSDDLIKIDSRLKGEIVLVCDKSGDEFVKRLDLPLVLFAKKGEWRESKAHSHIIHPSNICESSDDFVDDNLAVIEIFDNFVDLDSLFLGEIESIRLDYHTKD